MAESILFAGYGNVDRQDDGVAWHVMLEVAHLLNIPLEASVDEGIFPTGDQIDFSFSLQLVPEMAETIANYDRVCFIDAHTGRVPAEINFEQVLPSFQASPFTHHMTPATLVSMAGALYGRYPHSVLFSVRGYEFGFKRNLSAETARLVPESARQILDWMNTPEISGGDK